MEPSPPRRRLPRLLREPMWVLGLVVLVDEVDKNIVRGLIDPLKDEFGVGDFAIGVLLSLQLLFNGVVTVPAGYLADRWNRTRAIGTTVIAWSALTAAGAGALGFAMLVGLRSVLGFGQAVSEPSAASLLGDYYPPERRGKAFSIQMAMLFVGTGIGVALGGWLGIVLGWRWALVIVALPGIAVALLVYRLREPKRGTADLMAAMGGGEIEHSDGDHPRLFEHGFRRFLADMVDGLRADMRTVLRIRTMRYALVGVAALLFTVTAISSWLAQYYIRHLHVAEGDGEAWFMALAILAGVPGIIVGGRVADRYASSVRGGRLALPAVFLFVGTTFFTASFLIRPSEYTLTAIIPAFGLQLLGLFVDSMAIPGLRAGLTDALPAHLRGTGFGAFNLVAVVAGQAAAPFVVSAVSSLYGENLRVAFLVVSPLSFLGAAVLFRARKFLDEDMQKIMLAVLTALQEEQERQAAEAAAAPPAPAPG
ncbi:MAG TPA: MFS transporter [Acidimicrobiales bacterium]|nr:MFS transporter [Acidimicrobiales bacterium]